MHDFEYFYKQYYSYVYRFLLKLVNYDDSVAEELTQETFYHAYLGIYKFRGDSSVKTWILQIAKNRFLLYLRKKRIDLVSLDLFACDIADIDATTSFDVVYKKQLLARSLDIIFEMSDKMRDVFIYRVFSEYQYKKTSLIMSISESSAKVLFHRGKVALKKRLMEDYGYEV